MPRYRNTLRRLDMQRLDMPIFAGGGIHSLRSSTPLRDHAHPSYEITYVRDGEVTWELADGTALRLHGGQVALTQPDVPHRGELESIRPCELFWIWVAPGGRDASRHTTFSRAALARIDAVLREAGNCVVASEDVRGDAFDRARRLLDSEGATRGGDLWVAECRLALLELFLCTYHAIARSGARRRSPAIDRAAQFLRDHAAGDVSVDQAGRVAGLSHSRFFERFRQETGMSPHEYVLRHRCERARELLAEGGDSITRIALDLGFASSQHFASCFRRLVGPTPSEFRLRCEGRRRQPG